MGGSEVSSYHNLGSFRRKYIVKILSIVVLQTFIFYNAGFAAIDRTPATPKEKPLIQEISIDNIGVPKDIGSVKTRYQGKDGKKLVIHIQDAHCNYEAQTNISKILETLSKDYDVNLISVEGADGFIDTSWFKAFPDAEIRKEVADYFMKKGEITGAEFLSITEDYPIKLYGAENRNLYIKNLEAFTSTYPNKEAVEKYLTDMKTILGKLKGYIYTKKLKGFDTTIENYKAKEQTLSEYAKVLSLQLKRHKIDLKGYPDFAKLVYTLVYEDKIDFKVVDEERATLIDKLSKKLSKKKLQELVAKSFSFKTGKLTAAEYYTDLKKLSEENRLNLTKNYPNLANYVIYTRLYEKIDNEKLFEELDIIKNAIKDKLFKNEDQRTLSACWDNVNILLGLINIKLSNKEFDYYRENRAKFNPAFFTDFIQSKVNMYNLSYNVEEPSEIIKTNLPKLEKFYEIAIKRDKSLVNNTMKFMNTEKVDTAVLITGGFHTEGIKNILEQKGLSYVVVCPNITKDVESPYIQVLTNQKTPFEELLVESTVPKKEDSLLAPYSRARAIMFEDVEAREGLVAAIEAAGEELQRDWARRYVQVYLGAYKDSGVTFQVLRNDFLLAYDDGAKKLFDAKHENEIKETRGFIEEAFTQRRVLIFAEAIKFDEILETNHKAGTANVIKRDDIAEGFQFVTYDDLIWQLDGAGLPINVHPGHGGWDEEARKERGLLQAHIDSYIYESLKQNNAWMLNAIALEELMHLYIWDVERMKPSEREKEATILNEHALEIWKAWTEDGHKAGEEQEDFIKEYIRMNYSYDMGEVEIELQRLVNEKRKLNASRTREKLEYGAKLKSTRPARTETVGIYNMKAARKTQIIAKAITEGRIKLAVAEPIKLKELAVISNELLEHYGKLDSTKIRQLTDRWPHIERFYEIVISRAMFEDDEETAIGFQIISAKALEYLSMAERGLEEAKFYRVTADKEQMMQSAPERGLSYVHENTPVDATITEGTEGVLNRGRETGYTKLAEITLRKHSFNPVQKIKDLIRKMVMYVMGHGDIVVPEGLTEMTRRGRVSTMHWTTIIRGKVYSTDLHASTGKGHFQGKVLYGKQVATLDIKQVVKGRMLQLIDIYDVDGNIVRTLVHLVKKGETTLAIPGAVDYIIPLTDVVIFNDISVVVPISTVPGFNGYIQTQSDLKTIAEKVDASRKLPSHEVVDFQGEAVLAKVDETAPDVEWIEYKMPSDLYPVIDRKRDLISFYTSATEQRVNAIVDRLAGISPTYLDVNIPMHVMTRDEEKLYAEQLKSLRDLPDVVARASSQEETLEGIIPLEDGTVPVHLKDQHKIAVTKGGDRVETLRLVTGEPYTTIISEEKRHAILTLETKKTVEVMDEKGRKIAELKKGESEVVPVDGEMTFKPKQDGAHAVIKVMYPETEEKAVFATIEAVRSYLKKGVIKRRLTDKKKKGMQILLRQDLAQVLYRRGDPGGDGSRKAEEKIMESFLSKYLNTDIKITTIEDWSDEGLADKVDSGYLQASWIVDTEQRELLAGHKAEELRNLARFARIPAISSDIVNKLRDEHSGKGWLYVRELEALSLLFACTTPEDKGEDYARKLLNAVNLMTSYNLTDVNMLMSFLPLADDILTDDAQLEAAYTTIIDIILDKLPAEPYDVRDELHKRREVLWSV
jgi:hypothetical protein